MGAYLDLSKGESSGLTFKIPEAIYKAAFSPADWNRIKRDGLTAAGWLFITKFLPKRFMAFARVSLGYRSRGEQKHPRAMANHLPLVDSGTFRARLLAGAFPQAVATGNGLFIRTPFAHPLRPEHAAVLQRILPDELAAMNVAFRQQVAADIMEAGKRGKGRGAAVKLGLAPAMRTSIKLGLKDRAGARYHLSARRAA